MRTESNNFYRFFLQGGNVLLDMRRPSPLDLSASPSSGDPHHHHGRPQHAHSASPLAKQAPIGGGGGGGHPHSHHNLPSSVAPPTTSSGSSYLSRNSSGGSSNTGTPTRQAPIVRSQPQLSKSTSAFSLYLSESCLNPLGALQDRRVRYHDCRCCCLGIAPRARLFKKSAWLLHLKW